jgi:hypothetical protein
MGCMQGTRYIRSQTNSTIFQNGTKFAASCFDGSLYGLYRHFRISIVTYLLLDKLKYDIIMASPWAVTSEALCSRLNLKSAGRRLF